MCAKSRDSRVNWNCSEGGHAVSVVILLNLLPFEGGRADLQPSEKDLVPVLPHDEGPGGTDQSLGQVEHDLDQEVESEGPGDGLAVSHSLVGEGASYRVLLAKCANAVSSGGATAEATGLWVVVSGKRHHQHWKHQPDGTQDEVQNLQKREGLLEVGDFCPLLRCLTLAAVWWLTPSSKPSLCWLRVPGRLTRLPTVAGEGRFWPRTHAGLPRSSSSSHLYWTSSVSMNSESKNTAVKCDTASVLFAQSQ